MANHILLFLPARNKKGLWVWKDKKWGRSKKLLNAANTDGGPEAPVSENKDRD